MSKAALKRKYPVRYRKPWRVHGRNRKRDRKFKNDCLRAGLLSPNFSKAEARCHDGTDVPVALLQNAQRLAFALEVVRHECGNNPIIPLSWYRTRSHNAAVGGASQSRHMSADAIDPNRERMAEYGMPLYRFDNSCKRVFRTGGIGTDRRTGAVAHVDTRPDGPSRWTYG